MMLSVVEQQSASTSLGEAKGERDKQMMAERMRRPANRHDASIFEPPDQQK